MSVKLQKALITLLGYCKNKAKWQVTFDDAPYEHILPLAKQYFGDLWSYELFENRLSYYLHPQRNVTLNAQIAKLIIDDIEILLRQNMQDILIVLPLKGAWIPSTVIILQKPE